MTWCVFCVWICSESWTVRKFPCKTKCQTVHSACDCDLMISTNHFPLYISLVYTATPQSALIHKTGQEISCKSIFSFKEVDSSLFLWLWLAWSDTDICIMIIVLCYYITVTAQSQLWSVRDIRSLFVQPHPNQLWLRREDVQEQQHKILPLTISLAIVSHECLSIH